VQMGEEEEEAAIETVEKCFFITVDSISRHCLWSTNRQQQRGRHIRRATPTYG